MDVRSIALTAADLMSAEEIFQQQLSDLLHCEQITVLPPFPDYDLLGRSRAPKLLLKAANKAILTRKPTYDENQQWAVFPLMQEDKVLGLLLAEDLERKLENPEELSALERLVALCLHTLQLEKQSVSDSETGLWRRQTLMAELSRLIDQAESGSRLTPRRMLSEEYFAPHFTLICLHASPTPEPWAGAGPFWTRMGPRLAQALPAGAMAAHLGGGYVAILWRQAGASAVQAWTHEIIEHLQEDDCQPRRADSDWAVHAGSAEFPQDFYDLGPILPWEKNDGDRTAAASEEIIHRAVLAVETACKTPGEVAVTYRSMQEKGLAPRPEEIVEQRLSGFLQDDGPCSLLLVKLDQWEEWQHQKGTAEAARRAREVLENCRSPAVGGTFFEWLGVDRFVVFFDGLIEKDACTRAEALRRIAKTTLNTSVTVGISGHPCPGFPKSALLKNGQKALVHAGYLGPDAQVVFDAVSLNISGDRLFETGRFEQALAEFRQALMLDPANINVRNSLAVCLAQMGNMEEAVREFAIITASDEADFMPHYNLGRALWSLGREREAEEALKRAAELAPQEPGTWFQLATLQEQQGRLAEALRNLEKAVELKPRWPKAYRLLGEWLLRKGAHDRALLAFKKALKLHSDDARALSGLALIYSGRQANMEVALSLARRSVELEPDNILMLKRFAGLLLENQQWDEAARQCRRAAKLAPEDREIQRLMARIEEGQRMSTE
ncbi:MAG: tetratricopeptide repeat protein [Deltaproteobacteria bacterium]|nr:tetratricopeptide repeat protein [Deltaproteobacteria bacterium]MBW2069957.1 tetratricopeptide repeat protein [Deltaproteobacteria bacterium]